jgi:hypothetical protein
MPLFALDNGAELAPCVVSKARVALNLNGYYAGNAKRFTLAYWKRVLKPLTRGQGLPKATIRAALHEWQHYRNNRVLY